MKKIFVIFIICIAAITKVLAASNIDMDYNDGIYHFVLKGEKIKKQINFVSSPNLITNKEAHLKARSLFTINTGFFDPKNQKTISYIVSDYETVEDPVLNDAVMMNPVLRRNLKKILDRSEFRVLECDKEMKYEIAPHSANVDFLCTIKTSAQGGPQLLPDLRLEEEFFIVKDKEGNVIRESASVLHKTARTLIGIKTDEKGRQEAHIFIVTNKHPMDIYEARDLCKSYGLDTAMAFDGGSSTSLNYQKHQVTSTQAEGDTGRALKSFMIIKQ